LKDFNKDYDYRMLALTNAQRKKVTGVAQHYAKILIEKEGKRIINN
jgi:hypothetical protein